MSETNRSETDIFIQHLRKKGLSFTKQRKLILEQVFIDHDHFEAEDIVETLKRNGSRVSRATVYRTLAHLEDCKLIQKVDLDHGHSHYEHILGHEHHEHLYCKQCGTIIEFSNPEFENQLSTIAQSFNFTVTDHKVLIYGLCEQCT